MTITDVLLTLQNEYNSGQFYLDNEKVSWVYSTNGVNNLEEAEDRWLSFLGAKLTAEQVIDGTDYKIVEKFESNNKIGFSVEERQPLH